MVFCIKSIFYLKHTILKLCWANSHKVMSMILTSRYIILLHILALIWKCRDKNQHQFKSYNILYIFALCSRVFNFANTKQIEHLLHIQHTCTMHSTSIPWSCVKQTCEAVCPLNKYLHKCTSRSFKCIWNVGCVLLHIKTVVSTGIFLT